MTAAVATKQPVFKGRQLKTYVDPHPGLDRWDRVRADCVRCGGTGIYSRYHGVCFRCYGNGADPDGISVNTKRIWAKEDALVRDYAEELAVEREAAWVEFNAKQTAAEVARDHALALVMNERRNAAVQGFVAEVGAKVKGLFGEVVVATNYESHFGYSTQYGKFLIIKLDGGQVVKTSGTGATLFGVERGDRVEVTGGSVKAHEHYEGQDQTVLVRAKLARIEQQQGEAA